ncbi:putative glycogenin [Coprinellus micaceus]|uniref:glycogenin glucosyltransferase n=1 Tax=Coprinellus micaceus TaxID=71717 RepID=A0A4Y7TZB2_COPMI|nr:putative glycogenin [Coprinellus micaceus]
MASPFAFVTLVSSDAYLPGALAQVAALRDLHSPADTDGDSPAAPHVCLVTPETVDVSTIKLLRKAFDLVVGVEILEDANERGLQLLGRPDLTTVLTKLHVFRLTQFSKLIFLDADVLPLRPISHLFLLPHEFSAAPDVGWPDIFNSGVLVLSPGEDKFNELNDLLKSRGSWDGGDQGLLNEWRGNNWNRLSFTYNTTPTAAYTYAPAYERFGSEISALHFIGKNKPWNSMAYRAPFTTNSTPSDGPSQQAYDYDSLVDRWYAVYDKHYRSQPISAEHSFEFQKYTSAWDEPVTASSSQAVGSLGLDGLKQIAIEGIAASTSASNTSSSGDGRYISLPLDGRIDLMRPRKQHEEQQYHTGGHNQDGEPQTEQEDGPATPRMQAVDFRWHTLPTPQPHEVPPSPQIVPVALPPGTPHRFEPVRSDFYASESESDTRISQFSHEPHSHEVGPSFRSQLEGSTSPFQLTHPRPPRSGAPTPRRSRAASFSHTYQPPPLAQQQNRAQHSKPHEPLNRLASPPLLSWNPALESPPNDPPAPDAFPLNTYFPNLWDQSSASNSHSPANESSSALFVPLPPPDIPESLIKQGHYRNVTGEDSNGQTPSPDRTKANLVLNLDASFPNRKLSIRPALFLSPGSPSQTSTAAPSTPEQPKANGFARGYPLSPLFGLPSTISYANAWDTVPSIQKYATKLIRPPPPSQLAPAFDDERWRRPRKTWDGGSEVGSRDGDDGGNADDEDESDDDDDDTRWDDSDTESAAPPSKTPKATRYRDQAVQATPDTLDQGVQAPDTAVVTRKIRNTKRISIPSSGNFLVPPQRRDAAISAGIDSSTTATAVPRRPRSSRGASAAASASTSPAFTPRVSSPVRSSTREFIVSSPEGSEHPPRSVPEFATPPFKTPRPSHHPPPRLLPPVSFNASNDSSITSPAESSGAQTPLADGPTNGPVRTHGGRVWDPARGVEIFKRGSEEVLARFLRMGSWENDAVR